MARIIVETTDGQLVDGPNSERKGITITKEQAESSAVDRNTRAEELGIKTRYRAAEVE